MSSQRRLRRKMTSNIQALIRHGRTIGLPTRMLEKVYMGNYSLSFHNRRSGAETGIRTITFPRTIVKSLGSVEIDGIAREAKAVGLLFHEGTHALIQDLLKKGDRKFQAVHDNAKGHYTGAKFVDGSSVPKDGVESAVTEAAAWYVHEKVFVWWMAREIMEDLTRSGHTHKGSIITPVPLAVQRDLLLIRNYARKANYGTSWAGGDDFKRLAKAIHPGLKSFCDDTVLEGKIKLTLARYLEAAVAHHA